MSWIKKLLGISLMLIPSILLLEFGSYLAWTAMKKSPQSQGGQAAVESLLRLPADNRNRLVSNPYTLYWNNPDFEDPEFGRQYDRHGYRSDSVDISDESTTRILVLGGSTTNMWPYVKDKDKIWTSRLEQRLSTYLNRPVEVINAGIPYGTSAELLSHYLFLGKYMRPDYVIYHGGGNDAMPLFFPDYKTDYSHVRWSSNGVQIRSGFRTLLDSSYFFKLAASAALRGGVYNGSPPFSNLKADEVFARVKENDSIAFRENIDVLVNEAFRNDSTTFLIGFLQARKDKLSRNRPDLKGLEDSLVLSVEKHDQIMMDIADKYPYAEFLKLDQDKFADDWFFDNCHLNEEGEAQKAEQIFEFLKDRL